MTTFFAVLTALLGELSVKYPQSTLNWWAWIMFILMLVTVVLHVLEYEKVQFSRTKESNNIRRFIYLDLFTAAVLLLITGVIL